MFTSSGGMICQDSLQLQPYSTYSVSARVRAFDSESWHNFLNNGKVSESEEKKKKKKKGE